MYIPGFVVVLPCLASFLLSGFCYYELDPVNRLTDRHFVTGCAAVLAIIVFVLARILWPEMALLPAGFLLLALGLFGYAIRLLRQFLYPPAKPVQTLPTG